MSKINKFIKDILQLECKKNKMYKQSNRDGKELLRS